MILVLGPSHSRILENTSHALSFYVIFHCVIFVSGDDSSRLWSSTDKLFQRSDAYSSWQSLHWFFHSILLVSTSASITCMSIILLVPTLLSQSLIFGDDCSGCCNDNNLSQKIRAYPARSNSEMARETWGHVSQYNVGKGVIIVEFVADADSSWTSRG